MLSTRNKLNKKIWHKTIKANPINAQMDFPMAPAQTLARLNSKSPLANRSPSPAPARRPAQLAVHSARRPAQLAVHFARRSKMPLLPSWCPITFIHLRPITPDKTTPFFSIPIGMIIITDIDFNSLPILKPVQPFIFPLYTITYL